MNAEAVRIAREWLHTPYRSHARVKGQGVSCIELIAAVYEKIVGEPFKVPPYKNTPWIHRGGPRLKRLYDEKLVPSSSMKAGSVLSLRYRGSLVAVHSAIYCGSGTMIHAEHRIGCHESSVEPWIPLIDGIYEFPEKGGVE